MKITFLEIDTDSYWALASVGPGYIAAYVRSQGHAADMVRVAADDNINDVVDVRQTSIGNDENIEDSNVHLINSYYEDQEIETDCEETKTNIISTNIVDSTDK